MPSSWFCRCSRRAVFSGAVTYDHGVAGHSVVPGAALFRPRCRTDGMLDFGSQRPFHSLTFLLLFLGSYLLSSQEPRSFSLQEMSGSERRDLNLHTTAASATCLTNCLSVSKPQWRPLTSQALKAFRLQAVFETYSPSSGFPELPVTTPWHAGCSMDKAATWQYLGFGRVIGVVQEKDGTWG